VSRAILFSFVGHTVVLGVFFIAAALGPRSQANRKVYSVSIVPGVVTPGGGGSGLPGSGGKAEVGVQGMVGKPGKIGAPQAVSKETKPRGTALVKEATKKPAARPARADSGRKSGPEQIALRVYGTGGTIGGGGPAGPGGPGSGGAGRPATAFEAAMNNKILANWNENLWKALPDRLACTIQFIIKSDGAVTDVRIFESSRNEGFDLAARRAIELARMPAPGDFGMSGSVHQARVTFINRPE
jgi:TonB family protein